MRSKSWKAWIYEPQYCCLEIQTFFPFDRLMKNFLEFCKKKKNNIIQWQTNTVKIKKRFNYKNQSFYENIYCNIEFSNLEKNPKHL